MIIGLQAAYSKHRFTNFGIPPFDNVTCVWNSIPTALYKEVEPVH